MKERPILFNGDMVRAILEGRKTQTRRVMKNQPTEKPKNTFPKGGFWYPHGCARWGFMADIKEEAPWLCPFGKPGDHLWVRETWGFFDPKYDGIEWVPDRAFINIREKKFGKGYIDGNIIWAADGPFSWCDPDKSEIEEVSHWKPSIHMPRWASRIHLEIQQVRVERLQDISEEDAKAEGFLESEDFTPKGAFKKTWNDIYENWKSNPWVWVIEFNPLTKPNQFSDTVNESERE